MTEEEEQTVFKSIDALIATREENINKLSEFVRLFEERADENAMKIWVQCFKDVYRRK